MSETAKSNVVDVEKQNEQNETAKTNENSNHFFEEKFKVRAPRKFLSLPAT